MLSKKELRKLLEKYGKKYSEQLGIRLEGAGKEELFRWFIASYLFGKRIGENIAVRTYFQFGKDGLLEFGKARKAGWEDFVHSLDEGGYVRYDFSTADKLLAVMKMLGKYGGDLNRLHAEAKDARDLERRLMEFPGVGPVTANIFLRQLRGIWEKADPGMGPLARKAMRKLGIKDTREYWMNNKVKGYDFVNFEAMLTRYGKELRKKRR
ncbi:MAG: hypothetical protein AB1657_05930 [Candidatus Micrarchaeota archaeon]